MTTTSRPLVLMYHGVGDRTPEADPDNLFVSPEALRAQLSSLLRRGWRPLRLADYLAGAGGRRSFLVTFDDGYRSVHDVALPLLGGLGVPATVFVLAGLAGGRSAWMPRMPGEPLLGAAEILAVQAGGFDIGLHGLDHTALTSLPRGELYRQVGVAADRLAELTGRPPRAFAYPYGAHDPASRDAVAATGVEVAFATHRGAGRMAVPRVDVNGTDTAATFRVKSLPGYPMLRRLGGTAPGLRPAVRTMLGGGPI
jgi:peptidoglycan/xylan/chitin deacetylase (PgdA/CDA1 family)